MQQYMGDVFSGTIAGVANFGLFVTLDGLYVEGTVHITELGAEYFQHIEATHELRGSKTGKRYTVGQTVHVQVARVDLEARRIELKLTQADITLKAGHLKIKNPLSSNVIQDSQSDQTKPSKRTKNIVKTAIKIAKKAVDLPTLNVGVATKKIKKLKN
jgi:ribonuclease R